MRIHCLSSACLAVALSLLFTALAAAQDAATQPRADAKQPTADAKAPPKLYELRIYTTNPGKLPDLHARFRDHTMKLFEKHGIENVIYWTLAEDFGNESKDNTLVYVIAHKNKEAADASWAAFRADPEWQAVQAKSEENGKLLAATPVSVYLNPTDFYPGDFAPNAKSDKPARLFELRRYNDGVDRVPATVDRFKTWEGELFRNSGIETLGFWTTADNSAFVYLLGHQDRATADANWQTFFTGFRARGGAGGGRRGNRGANPSPQVRDDQAATPPTAAAQDNAAQSAAPTRRGRGGAGGGIERRWLIPTEYSPRK